MMTSENFLKVFCHKSLQEVSPALSLIQRENSVAFPFIEKLAHAYFSSFLGLWLRASLDTQSQCLVKCLELKLPTLMLGKQFFSVEKKQFNFCLKPF